MTYSGRPFIGVPRHKETVFAHSRADSVEQSTHRMFLSDVPEGGNTGKRGFAGAELVFRFQLSQNER
jgi:hypothetical protein